LKEEEAWVVIAVVTAVVIAVVIAVVAAEDLALEVAVEVAIDQVAVVVLPRMNGSQRLSSDVSLWERRSPPSRKSTLIQSPSRRPRSSILSSKRPNISFRMM
jgi:hypothetical protein